MTGDRRKVAVIGCGRIGAPMLMWLHKNKQSFDYVGIEKNSELIGMLRSGKTGWYEEGLDAELLNDCPPILHSSDLPPTFWSEISIAIICLGSPVDDHGTPDVNPIRWLCSTIPKNVSIVLRSTVPVGFTEDLSILLDRPIYFAPERILTGSALKELDTLPQVLGISHDGQFKIGEEHVIEFMTEVFPEVHMCNLKEAELCKIGNNIIRYIEFTAGTQFAEAVEYYGEDWEKVRKLMTAGYDRGSMRMPSFTSSYCLNKDFYMLDKNVQPSLSIASAEYNQFYFLENLWTRALDMTDKQRVNVGILGWTYRPESDDDRDTIVEYLGDLLSASSNVARVTYFDPVKNPSEQEFSSRTGLGKHARRASSAQAVILSSDIIIIATAHPEFEQLQRHFCQQTVIDPSGLVNGNTRFVRWFD